MNTTDNSRREWPRLISSVKNLITDQNVYSLLATDFDDNQLLGFNVEQRKEEMFKAKFIEIYPSYKNDIFKIEDHNYLTGRITNLLLSPFAETEQDFDSLSLEKIVYTKNEIEELLTVFIGYVECATNEFNNIWGNLLITSLYKQTNDSRLVYSNYRRHPAVIMFAKRFALQKPKITLSDYIVKIQKEFLVSMSAEYSDLSFTMSAKEQLYIYFIIGERLYGHTYKNFFKNSNYNIGWLAKSPGFKSHFIFGIEACQYFSDVNPIFQFYNQQFRYNLGLNPNNTLDIEIVGGGKKRNPLELISEWANN